MTLLRAQVVPALRRFARQEDATATIEFVITFPVVMMLFIAVFETSMIMTRQVMLERTLDQAARILRLADGLTVTAADIRTAVCDNTTMLPDCDTLLVVDLRQIDRTTYAMPGNQELCIERADASATVNDQFTVGGNNDIMLIRACMIVDRILPFSGFGLNLTRDDSGGLHMMAATAFVNEPDTGTSSTGTGT